MKVVEMKPVRVKPKPFERYWRVPKIEKMFAPPPVKKKPVKPRKKPFDAKRMKKAFELELKL
jgi:hypothetical protein